MNRVKKLLLWVVPVILLSTFSDCLTFSQSLAPVPNDLVTVKTDKSVFTQGETIFTRIETEAFLSNPKAIFAGKEYKIYQVSGKDYVSMLGIAAVQKAGGYTVKLKDDTNKLNESFKVEIKPAGYPIQHISIGKSKSSLTPTPRELAEIQKGKVAISESKMWGSFPPFNSPTKGCMSSVYGVSRYVNGKPTGDFHKGVDVKAPYGQAVYSVAGGNVTVAENFRLHGGTVMVNHGHGLTSIYIHFSKINVRTGDKISQGHKIGEIGSTGFATGPHLHWGLYINGIPVDPMKFWLKPVTRC